MVLVKWFIIIISHSWVNKTMVPLQSLHVSSNIWKIKFYWLRRFWAKWIAKHFGEPAIKDQALVCCLLYLIFTIVNIHIDICCAECGCSNNWIMEIVKPLNIVVNVLAQFKGRKKIKLSECFQLMNVRYLSIWLYTFFFHFSGNFSYISLKHIKKLFVYTFLDICCFF